MLLLTLSGGGSSLPTAVAQTAMYTVTDLGVLPGASDSYAYGINDRGQVVGESSGRAFLWQDGRMISLGALGDGNKGSARAINNNGQIVGTSTFSSTSLATHAFVFAVDATGNVISRTDLGTLPGHIGSIAHAINDMGRVAGYSGSQCCVAVYWDGGKITVLARLDTQNPVNWAAYAVNASGQMAGWEGSFAMAWDPAPRRLPANGEGYGINDTGQIVGAARAPGASHSTAFLLNPGAGAALNLGTLPGGVNSGAFDINNAGEVVGYSDGNLGTRAIRWVPSTANGTSGVMTDLNTLIPANSGWTLMRARAINNSGQIVGDGLRGNVNRGFLLTPAAPADTTPPTTTAAVSPMTNAAGWHTANVTVTLTATDNSGGSDVKEIVYDTGGGPVSEAGATASVAITTEGTTSLSYFARDKAGNVEMPAKMLMIRLDKTAPTIAITAPTMTAYTLGQAVAASYSCMDGGSGSGVVTCVGPVPAGSALDTSAIGARTFTVDATD